MRGTDLLLGAFWAEEGGSSHLSLMGQSDAAAAATAAVAAAAAQSWERKKGLDSISMPIIISGFLYEKSKSGRQI